MKKRILSLLLALVTAVSLFPVSAFAVDETCSCPLTDGVHYATCPLYTCPDCGTAGWHETCPEVEGDTGSTEEPGEGETEEPGETTPCEICGNDPCTCEPAAEDCSCPLTDGVHDATCPNYVCPDCGTAGWHETCPEVEGDTGSTEEPGEGETEEPGETTPCEICGNDPCTCEPAAEDCSCPMTDGVHDATCPNYVCPDCGTAGWHETCPETEEPGESAYDFSGDIGKLAQLVETDYCVFVNDVADIEYSIDFYYSDFVEGTIFKITGWYVGPDNADLWYQVEFYSGGVVKEYADLWPAEAWILQNYLNSEESDSLEFIPCPICGEDICTKEHIRCPVCGEYDCAGHTYCGVCGTMDCPDKHIYCEICRDFDCGLEHEKTPVEVWTPSTAPVIPENPQLPDEYDVALVDGTGTPVGSENGLLLGWNEQASLSAWSALGEDASYQWQIFIDEAEGFWLDITGQTGKGLLFSRALLMNALNENGCTWLRCVTALDGEGMTSDAVRVCVDVPQAETSLTDGDAPMLFSMQNRSLMFAAARDIPMVTITIKYLEAESFLTGGTEVEVTKPYVATIPAGEKFEQTVLAPSRPGYAPFWDIYEDNRLCTGEDYYNKDGSFTSDGGPYISESAAKMNLTLTADETLENRVYYVYYLPVKVNMGIRYFFQNVDNDNYTEDTTLYYQGKERTGTTISEDDLQARLNEKLAAQGKGPLVGFTRMIHQSEPVAADGSTVFECYYDREYVMLHFSLDGGYGVEPVYARYETPVSVPDPIKPGYTFLGWDLLYTDTNSDTIPDQGDGAADTLPATIPAAALRYIALWEPKTDGSKYTVAYWRENADPEADGTYKYSLWGSAIVENATAGQTVSGKDDVPNDISDGEKQFFTYNDAMTDKNVEVRGDGTTMVNVYYTRNFYTIEFKGYGQCALPEHTHGTNCSTYLICGIAEEHTHTDACGNKVLSCGQTVHLAHTDECLLCTHQCDLDCFTLSNNNRYLREITKPNNTGTTADGYVYTLTQGSGRDQVTYYYLKQGDKWYCAYSSRTNEPSPTTSITRTCSHVEHDEACYKDTLHDHTDSCYSYTLCSKTAHTHTNACYSKCSLTEHTHNTTCTSNNTNNVVYVITAKYNAYIGDIWPTYDVLGTSAQSKHYRYTATDGTVMVVNSVNGTKFRGWGGLVSQQESISKRVNMTSDLCNTSTGVKTATANYGGSYTYRLFYMFESFNQTIGEKSPDPITREARRRYPANTGIWYDSDPDYYQEVTYTQNTTFTQKEITGMTKVSDGVTSETKDGIIYNFLYYNRNRHVLKFQSIDTIIDDFTQADVMYGQKLTAFEPDKDKIPYHPNLEKDGYYFDGWYYNADFIEKVDFVKDTMPDRDLTLHAKWSPQEHTVRFFRHYEYMEEWLATPEGAQRDALTAQLIADGNMIVDEKVLHGYLVNPEVGETVLNWTYPGNDTTAQRFGFFYMEDGQKKAFSPQDIPVRDDLIVYAEWRGEAEHPYRIEYVLKSDGTPVADPTVGYFRLGVLHTFFAKAGTPYNQLYDAYNNGYFPLTASHSMVIQAEDNKDVAANNVHRFEYAAVTNVTYTVYYVDKATGNQITLPNSQPNPKTVTTSNAVVTESYVNVTGYVPDAFYKQLVLSVKEDENGNFVGDDEANVITFYYTKNITDAPYAVHHMLQKPDGAANNYAIDGTGGYEEYGAVDEGIEAINSIVAVTPRDIVGFTPATAWYYASPTATAAETTMTDGKFSFQVTASGAQLYIFYTRNSYGYTVHYYQEGTAEQVTGMDPLNLGPVPYGSSVTATASLYSPDYTFRRVSAESQSIDIRADETLNEIIFYYAPIQYRVDYVAVPEAGGGFTPASQEIVTSGKFNGAKPLAKPNYKFVGWYLDEACSVPVTAKYGTVDTENGYHLKPVIRTNGTDPITEYTFYAKFELQAADFTITRSDAASEDQVFVYRVAGTDLAGNSLSIDVTIVGNDSVTIAKLPFGNYTVTQLNGWSWRYSDAAQTVNHAADHIGSATFGGVFLTKWLSGISNFFKNIFGGT